MPRPGLAETIAVWGLHACFALLTLLTYSRLEPEVLHNVSGEGLAGGASRLLVYLNFPLALVAVALVAAPADRLRGRAAGTLAALAAGLSAVAAVPGVLDLDDLDARPVNGIPAAGVVLAAALTAAALWRGGLGRRCGRLPGDGLRVALGLVLLLVSVPWLFAEAGFSAPDPILAEEVPPGEAIAAVHLGRHHGTDGALLAVGALLLSRALPAFRRRRLAAWTSAYLALMLAYGLVLCAEDVWLEQLVKRGTTALRIPSLLQPEPEWGWLAVVLLAAGLEAGWFRRERRPATRARLRTAAPAPRPP